MTTVPSLTEGLAAIFRVLLGTGTGGELLLDARTSCGFGHQRIHVSVAQRGLSGGLLELLGNDPNWAVDVRPAIYSGSGSPQALWLNALVARWRFAPVFNRTEWQIPTEQYTAVDAALQAFGLTPSIVVNAVSQMVVYWQLSSPIDISTDAGRAATLALQRRLAVRLGSSFAEASKAMPTAGDSIVVSFTDDDPIAGFFPLCGIQRDMGTVHRHIVHVEHITDVRYNLAALEAAIAKGDKRK